MKEQLIPSPTSTGQQWNTAAYAANGRFVATLASGIVELLAPQVGERILDLGCGDGALTEQLAATGAIVTGVDASESMVAAARARGLNIDHASATALPYQNQFDAVFSNAALHWIRDANSVLRGVHRALKPGGRFVAEMGGHGNIAAIRTALQATLAPLGIDAEEAAASFFRRPRTTSVSSKKLISRYSPLSSSLARHLCQAAWRRGLTPFATVFSTGCKWTSALTPLPQQSVFSAQSFAMRKKTGSLTTFACASTGGANSIAAQANNKYLLLLQRLSFDNFRLYTYSTHPTSCTSI